MATLQLTVFEVAASTALGDPLQEEVVTVGAGSLTSNVIVGSGNVRRTVRLYTDTDCFVTWGESPTAKTDGTAGRMLGADNPEYYNIQSGHKIAVIERV
jgi:hypothetical protein